MFVKSSLCCSIVLITHEVLSVFEKQIKGIGGFKIPVENLQLLHGSSLGIHSSTILSVIFQKYFLKHTYRFTILYNFDILLQVCFKTL